MNSKELIITPPEGWEVDETKSTFTKIVYKEIVKEQELPTKWEDLKTLIGFYVSTDSNVIKLKTNLINENNKNVFVTEKQAKASVALSQLSQLMKIYNGDWKPNWNDNKYKYGIYFCHNNINIASFLSKHNFLTFKTPEIRDEFLKHFKDLIEIAKPLLG